MTGRRLVAVLALIALPLTAGANDCLDYSRHFHWANHVDTPNHPYDGALVGDHLYVADGSSGVRIVDVSDPLRPELVGGLPGVGRLYRIAGIDGQLAAIDADDGLRLFDILAPETVALAASLPSPTFQRAIAYLGTALCLADEDGGFRILDTSNPAEPDTLASLSFGAGIRDILCRAPLVILLLEGDDLRFLDCSDPAQPQVLSSLHLHYNSRYFCMDGDYLYVVGGGRLQILDIAEPAAPRLISATATGGSESEGLAARSGQLFTGLGYSSGDPGLVVIDVSDPTAPRQQRAHARYGAEKMVFVGDCLYVLDFEYDIGVFTALDSPPATLAGRLAMDLDATGFEGSRAYVVEEGLGKVLDLTNPLAPEPSGQFSTGLGSRQLTVIDGRLLVTGYDPLLSIYGLADPDQPELFGALQGNGTTGLGVVPIEDDRVVLAQNYAGGAFLHIVWISPEGMPVNLDAADVNCELSALRSTPEPNLVVAASPVQGLVLLQVVNDWMFLTTYFEILGGAQDLIVDGDFAYVALGVSGFCVVDLHNYFDPWICAQLATPYESRRVAKFGDVVYVWDNYGCVTVVDASAPYSPRLIGNLPIGGYSYRGGEMAMVQGTLIIADEWGLSFLYPYCGASVGGADLPPALAATLYAPYPNPFNPDTRLRFTLPGAARARLSIFDVAGRLQANLLDGALLSEGLHEVPWDGRDAAGTALPSGVYLARLWAGGETSTQKLTLLR